MTKHDSTRRPTGPDPADYEEHLYQAHHATMSRRMLTKIATKLLDKNLYNKTYNPAFSLNKAATWYKPKNVAYLYKLLRRLGLNTSTGEYTNKKKGKTNKSDFEQFVDDLSDNLTVTDMNALRDYFAMLSKYNANAKYNKNHTAAHRRAINAKAVRKYRAKQQAQAAQQTAGAKENLINNLTNQNATTLTDQQKQVQKEQAEKMKKAQQERVAADAKQKQEQEQTTSQNRHAELVKLAAKGISDEHANGAGKGDTMGLGAFQRALKDSRDIDHFYKIMLSETHGNAQQLYFRAIATGAKAASEVEKQGVQAQTPVLLDEMVIGGQIQSPTSFEAYYGQGRQARRLYYARLVEMLVLDRGDFQ